MNTNHLHVISFDIPYPPNYGGVIDVFYKIKSLAEVGVKIHLHCFEYGRKQTNELKKFCVSVNYYPRKNFKTKLFDSLPYREYSSQTKVKLTTHLHKIVK